MTTWEHNMLVIVFAITASEVVAKVLAFALLILKGIAA